MTAPRQRKYEHQHAYRVERRALAQEAEQRRRNDLETLAIQVGLSYSTVVDLLRSGWKYSEVPGLKPRWIKVV